VLHVNNIHKSYDELAVLTGVSFRVAAGEIASLLGPNGAGKTTLMSIIAGLRSADAGTVHISGFNIETDRRSAINELGLAPQDTAVQLALTARENLQFYAELAGISRKDAPAQVAWAIDAMELASFADRKAQLLSGGERRRLHSAAAIVGRPTLLLLDEPTVGADLSTRSRLLEAVRNLADNGTAVVYTTHYLPEVEELNARVLILDDGHIIADGPLTELLDQHATAAVELSFDGAAPDISHPAVTVVRDGSSWRGSSDGDRTVNITTVAADVLGGLGPDAARLKSIEVLQGSLDSVFLALTGRRYKQDADGQASTENAEVTS